MANERYYAERAKRGKEFLAEMAKKKAEWRAKGNDKGRHKIWKKSLKARLCQRARIRGRKRGLEATIKTGDLHWPDYCPVLGLKLNYDQERGDGRQDALPSLDRWDNTKGYVKGNVFVISFRANTIKSNATVDELKAILDYAEHGPLTGWAP